MKLTKTIPLLVGFALALSAGAASAATAQMPYIRDLTLGSTGADVVSLQTTLVSKGFLVIPAGVPMGYFGPLTKASLARYQAANGIAPAVGYFGPITRAHFNVRLGEISVPGTTTGNSGNAHALRGGEGDIKNFDILGNPSNEDINEGESKKVLGFEFEAKKSDLEVQRLDVFADISASAGASKPWKVIDSARLLMGSKEIADVDLGSKSDWDKESTDLYSFRFDDLDAVVEDGETAKFYVEVTAKDSIDSDDDPTDIDFYIPTDGLRAVDAKGIDIYEGAATDERTATFGEAESGNVKLSIDDSDNEDRTVFVDENNDTNGVEIMRFKVESKTSDNVIDELQVVLSTTTATSTTLSEVIKNLSIEVDGDEIASESVPSGNGPRTITFEDLADDFEIAEDDEVEVVIYADLDSQEGNYGEGYTFQASVAGSGMDVEDASGDNVNVTSSVTGGEIDLRVNGIQVDLVSASTVRVLAADPGTAGSADAYSFEIKFEVSAEGDDVYVDKSVQNTESPSVAGSGVAWATTSESTALSTVTNSSTLSATGSTSNDTATAFKINDGSSRTFTLKVVLEATADNSTAIQLTGINWTNSSSDTTPDEYYTFSLDDFKTDLQYMNFI